MAQSNSKMEAVLIQTMADVNHQLVQQREFAIALESFQQKLLQDLESTRIQGQSHLTRLMKDVGSAAQNLVTRITSLTSIFEVNLTKLANVLQKSNNDAVNLDRTVGEAFRRAAQGASELAEAQTKQWDDNNDLAIRLQTSLESISSQNIHELLDTLSNIQNQLQSTNHLIVAMHSRQNELSNRLNNLDTSFESLEIKAQTFTTLQTAQAEVQLHLYQQTQMNMQTTSERLAVIDASASSIGTKISNLSSVLAQLSSLFAVLSSVSRYWWQVALIVVAVWFSRRLTALIFYNIIFNLQNMPPTEIMLTHHASGLQVPLSTFIKVAGVLALFLFLYITAKHLHHTAALKDPSSEPWQCFPAFLSSRVPFRFRTPSDGIVFDIEC
ncbi:hypothetical protein MMC34_002827 [Xylographa carneopallida]|nr:hypothetical protein [Xylographa carneopallida]